MLKVSIITPSFNYAQYLSAAIDSVLSQDYPDIEYIVIDGGSTDGTLDVLNYYGGRIRWISEPDRGQSDAINKGLALVSGDIVGWLNADDLLQPGAVRQVIEAFERDTSAGLVYGDVEIIDAKGRFVAFYPFVQPCNFKMLRDLGDFIVQPGTFWRRDHAQRQPLLDVDLHWTMDYELWLYLTQRTKPVYIPYLLASQREHVDTKTSQGGMARFAEIQGVLKRYGRDELPAGFQDELSRLRFSLALTDPTHRAAILGLPSDQILRFASRHISRQPDDLSVVLKLIDEAELSPLIQEIIEQAAAARLAKAMDDVALIREYDLDESWIRRLASFERGKHVLIHERNVAKALPALLKAHLWRDPHWWMFAAGSFSGGTLFRRYVSRGRIALRDIPIVGRLLSS